MNILVVDDDLVSVRLLGKILSKHGYLVTHAPDGFKALEALQSATYRIILTDWMMPQMDGPELCRRIRKLELPQHVYIILLTSKSSKNDAVTGLESGADDYIVKPFDTNELLARIRAGRRLIDLQDANRQTLLKLSRSEKLAAVGHLAAGIAHEINNPIGFIGSNLNSLAGYIADIREMLSCYRSLAGMLDISISQNKLHPDLPRLIKQTSTLEAKYDIDFLLEDITELLSDSSSGAKRIQAIVHEMRYFAHPEKQVIEPFQIKTILDETVVQFTARLPAGVRFEFTLQELPQIACNHLHLEQAFNRLVENALEAVGVQGRIVIEGQNCGDALEIRISDTGRGIMPQDLPKVFDPFFTTKEVGQGVGLGLTTALNIIKMHNGTIRVESDPGVWTSFIVRLPLARQSAAA